MTGDQPPSEANQPEHVELNRALKAARDDDGEAFRALYRATQPRLLRYVCALVGADAEDVTSEAWLRIARDLRSFTGDYDDFRGWAATIARHRAVDHRRREQRRPSRAMPVDELHEVPGREDTAGQALDSVGARAAVELIARLPRDQAEAVLLRAVVGLDATTAGKCSANRPARCAPPRTAGCVASTPCSADHCLTPGRAVRTPRPAQV